MSCLSQHIIVFPGDKNSFLFEFPDTSGDYYVLLKENGSIKDLVGDNIGSTYGVKYPIGTIANYPYYGGYQIDWQKVYNEQGSGVYYFGVYNTSSYEDSIFSLPFTLKESTDSRDNTFYVEVLHNGRYKNFLYNKSQTLSTLADFDLVNTTWEDSCRYVGKLTRENDEQTDTLVTYRGGKRDYFNEHQYTESKLVYNARIYKILDELILRLSLYGLRADEIKITDYSLQQTFTFEKVDILPEGGSPSYEQFKDKNLLYNVNFKLRSARDFGFSRL